MFCDHPSPLLDPLAAAFCALSSSYSYLQHVEVCYATGAETFHGWSISKKGTYRSRVWREVRARRTQFSTTITVHFPFLHLLNSLSDRFRHARLVLKQYHIPLKFITLNDLRLQLVLQTGDVCLRLLQLLDHLLQSLLIFILPLADDVLDSSVVKTIYIVRIRVALFRIWLLRFEV